MDCFYFLFVFNKSLESIIPEEMGLKAEQTRAMEHEFFGYRIYFLLFSTYFEIKAIFFKNIFIFLLLFVLIFEIENILRLS